MSDYQKFWKSGATIEQYDNPLGRVEKKISKLNNDKPCEVNIG